MRLVAYLGIIGLFLCLAIFRLDTIPGDWFGDISNLHEFVLDIEHGSRPISYRQSVGPLYHYSIAPFVHVTQHTYLDYKLFSVLSGAFSLIAIMLLSKKLFGKRTILFTGIITATSFWLLVWSRLGNLHASIPGVVAFTLYFFDRWKERKKNSDLVIGAVISSLGLFLYIPLIVLPFVYLFLSMIVLIGDSKNEKKTSIAQTIILISLVLVPAFFIFSRVIMADTSIFFNSHGYIGEKFALISTLSLPQFFERLIIYPLKTAGMFFIVGDSVFRVNVPLSPLLDPLSGMFLIIGSVIVWKRITYRWLFIPLLLLAIPGMFPSILPQEIPSSTRTIGMLPIIVLLIGVGVDESIVILQRYNRMLAAVLSFCIFLLIGAVTVKKYFVDYPTFLPNHNAAFARTLASFIDTLSPHTQVLFSECCWADWGEPEPKAVYYQLKKKNNRETMLHDDFDCTDITDDTVVIIRPEQKNSCGKEGKLLKDIFGKPMATIVTFEKASQ